MMPQDKGRCFGEYRCPKCKRTWRSVNSWPGYGQTCTKCSINVFPHEQRPLKRSDGIDTNAIKTPHPEELCQKCKALGHCCAPSI